MATEIQFVGAEPIDAGAASRVFQQMFQVPAQAAVGDASVDVPLFRARGRSVQEVVKLKRVAIIPAADIVNNETNNLTFDLINRGSDGNGTAVMATANTDAASGQLDAHQEAELTIDHTKVALVGEYFSFKSTQSTGAGLLQPVLRLIVEWEVLGQ